MLLSGEEPVCILSMPRDLQEVMCCLIWWRAGQGGAVQGCSTGVVASSGRFAENQKQNRTESFEKVTTFSGKEVCLKLRTRRAWVLKRLHY